MRFETLVHQAVKYITVRLALQDATIAQKTY
jgi:hypothetical protein